MARTPKNNRPVVLETRVTCGMGGGPEKTILNSPRHLWSAGYNTICACMHPVGDPGFGMLQQRAKKYQAPLVSIPDRGPWDWRVVTEFLNLCRRERVAIWHGHDYKSNLLGLLVQRFWPMRLVTTVHGWVKHTRRTPLYYWIDRKCLPRYEMVLCVSKDLHQECLQIGVSPDRCQIIENGIDVDEFQRKKTIEEAKKHWNLSPNRLAIGAVGRLSDEKGFDKLIQAVHSLTTKGKDLDLLVAGTGDAESKLKTLIRELGLQDRVHLLGHVADPRQLYEACDLFALSSYREGLPNVVLEAMALEVPVVATRVNGVPGVIRHQVNGLLIEPGSVEGLVDALDHMLSDESKRRQFAFEGRRTIVEHFDFVRRMDRIRGIYDGLLDRN